MQMTNKGQLGGLATTVIIFVVVVVAIAMGATILDNIQDTQTTGSYAYNATNNGLSSMDTFSDQLPTLAIVIVAGVIITVLATAFVLRS